MYRSKILKQIKLYCFIKFIVHEMNSIIVKSKMMVLIGREKTVVDMGIGCKLQSTAWSRSE
jgi:hypothetical protein